MYILLDIEPMGVMIYQHVLWRTILVYSGLLLKILPCVHVINISKNNHRESAIP